MTVLKFTGTDEWDFYPLSPSLDVFAQPRRIKDFLLQHFPNHVIQDRAVLKSWMRKPFVIEYSLIEKAQP